MGPPRHARAPRVEAKAAVGVRRDVVAFVVHIPNNFVLILITDPEIRKLMEENGRRLLLMGAGGVDRDRGGVSMLFRSLFSWSY